MRTVGLRALIPAILAGCYSPNVPSGKLQCGPGGSCPEGYSCAADNHCYKPGFAPVPDLAVARDLAMPCTPDGCKATPKPICDPV